MIDEAWLLAVHIAAAVTWIGGVIVLGVVGVAPGEAVRRRLATWNRRVTTPAMLATWGLGITLAMRGGWFAAPWLAAKITIVVALSGLHGVLSGRLRRASAWPVDGEGATLALPSATVAAVAAIAVLVVVKPF